MDVKEMGECYPTYALHITRPQTKSYRYTKVNYVLGVFNLYWSDCMRLRTWAVLLPGFPGKRLH